MLTSLNRETYLLTHKEAATSHSKPASDKQLNASSKSVSSSSKRTGAADEFADPTQEVERSVDPLHVLGITSVQVRHITELHLGKMAQTAIHPNVQLFVNLDTLWLNDNRLRRIDNLTPKLSKHPPVAEDIRGCFRLKKLYLSNNRVVSLSGDLSKLKYLEVLLLANNLLSNMETVSAQLKHLGRLQQLDLFGNPLSEEQRYRPYFIFHHPSIEVLDRRHVTDEERAEAQRMFQQTGSSSHNVSSDQKSSVYAFGGSIRIADIPVVERATEISLSVGLLESKVNAIKAKKKAEEIREATKEQTLLEEIAGKRKSFHGIWEFAGKDPIAPQQAANAAAAQAKAGGPSPMPQSTKASPVIPTSTTPEAASALAQGALPKIVTKDRFQSRIFTGDGEQEMGIRRLIELQEQLEASRLDPNGGERTLRLVRELRQLRHLMIPEREGDGFNDVLGSRKAATLQDDVAEYLRHMSQDVFILPHEMANLRKMFPAETSPNFNSESVDGLLGALDKGGRSVCASDLAQAFRSNSGLGEKKSTVVKKTSSKQLVEKDEAPLDLNQALALLVCFTPFVHSRAEYLVEYTNKLLLKEAQPEAARAFFSKLNEANEHLRLLERHQVSSSGRQFVTLTTLSKTATPLGAFF